MKFDTEQILDFWFVDTVTNPESYESRMEVWFMPNEEFDIQIRSQFKSQIPIAVELAHRGLSSHPRENLARIIVIDQFSRNIFRGTPRAFEFDPIALKLTKNMIDSGMHEQMEFVERLFVYLPLQHAEDINVQLLSIEMYKLLESSAEHPIHQTGAEQSLEYAILHKEIIERFGRFPHRNEILGRESTSEELEYLSSGPETFGQVKMTR